ncbi:MAG TPA: hypothetical protein VMX55_06910 [candidate division Zixibacteria bacterium]|nr:hypothetical protein [candidate division Zixibacteria bacterium]
MNVDNDINKINEVTVNNWAQEIISINKFNEETFIEDIVQKIADFFEKLYSEMRITISDIYEGEKCLRIGLIEKKETKKQKKDEEDIDFDLFASLFDESIETEETKILTKHIQNTYRKIFSSLNKINPSEYANILEKINLKPVDKIPAYNEDIFISWSNKIISYFKLNKSTKLNTIIRNTIEFFDMMFPNYNIVYYSRFKDKNRFPVLIDKKYEDSLMWAVEIDEIRTYIFCVYKTILELLKREKEAPEDPSFWFDLTRIYEIMGQREKAHKYGEKGLLLNPKELDGLSMLMSYYIENRRIKDGLIYFKRMGHIYKEKNMLKQAIDIWDKVVQFEPSNKGAWRILANLYKQIGNEFEAQKCMKRAA